MSQLAMDIGPCRPLTMREKVFGDAVEYMAGFIRQGMTYEEARTSIMGQGGPGQPRIDLRSGMIGVWLDGVFITSFPLERVWVEAERRVRDVS